MLEEEYFKEKIKKLYLKNKEKEKRKGKRGKKMKGM